MKISSKLATAAAILIAALLAAVPAVIRAVRIDPVAMLRAEENKDLRNGCATEISLLNTVFPLALHTPFWSSTSLLTRQLIGHRLRCSLS